MLLTKMFAYSEFYASNTLHISWGIGGKTGKDKNAQKDQKIPQIKRFNASSGVIAFVN